MKRKIICMAIAATLLVSSLIPSLSALGASSDDDMTMSIQRMERLFYEDHVGKKITDLTSSNSDKKQDGKSPLSNLYDLDIVGSDHPTFSTFAPGSKNLQIQGNHSHENTSKNIFILDNANSEKVVNRGMFTIIPKEKLEGLEEFTISYIFRTHKPEGGQAGLMLFYDSAITGNDGNEYFGGYNNYTFTGYTGSYMNSYHVYSVYDDIIDFDTDTMDTKHRNEESGDASNDAIYTKIHATKGEYTVDGVTYTAKIESYSDDKLVATSYAYWADAPVFFYFSTTASRWSVQFTNLELRGKVTVEAPISELLEDADPVSIEGTSVRYDGIDGLRVLAGVKKDDIYSRADACEVGAILIDKDKYTGTLDVSTEGAIVKSSKKAYKETDELFVSAEDFEAPEIDGDKVYMAAAYAKYTFGGKDIYAYSDPRQVSCAATAAKVTAKYASIDEKKGWEDNMLSRLEKISGPISTYKIMGLNILAPGTNSSDPGWQLRIESLINMLKDTEPDVAGFSEVSDLSYLDQWSALTNDEWIDANYAAVYSDSDPLQSGGSGEEGLGIIYRKDKFELISSGTKYLSDTPDSPTLSQDEQDKNDAALAANPDSTRYYPRKMLYALLRDKQTGAVFAAVDTHLTHASVDSNFSIGLRKRQISKLIELCTSGDVFEKDTPFVVFGDMNAKVNGNEYNVFLEDGLLLDVRYDADVAPNGTQGTYHVMTGGNTFIDHMFMSEGDFYAQKFDIITDKYPSATAGDDIYYSDHYAIMGTLTVLP